MFGIMYTGIAEREVRLLCYDCGGVYAVRSLESTELYIIGGGGGGLRLRDDVRRNT